MKRSTGFRNATLSTGAIPALTGKVLKLFSGAIPASADDALAAGVTPLCVVSLNDTGNGLSFSAPTGGQVTKNTSEVWSGTITASGTATFFRMEDLTDAGAASTTNIRVQGTVAQDGADMNLGETALVAGNLRQIKFFVLTIPAG